MRILHPIRSSSPFLPPPDSKASPSTFRQTRTLIPSRENLEIDSGLERWRDEIRSRGSRYHHHHHVEQSRAAEGRWRSVYRDKDRISGCDGTAERRPDSRLPPTFVNHAAESKTSARSMCPPRPFEASSAETPDDGPRRRRRRERRRRGRAYKQTITRETFGIHSPCSGAAVRFFFSNPLHRAEASAWPDLRG